MISLKKLLDIPRFTDLQLITDEKLLNNQVIDSVEITETPDVANYIPKNVLVLTTGMAFQNKQKDLIPFIQSLIQADAIGLGIKINRFLKEITPEVIFFANKNNFPLIIIPDHYQLGALLHRIMNIVWNTEREEIEFALDVQKRFSNLLVQNAPNDLLVNEFSQMIEAPIILLNPFREIIAHSRHFNNRDYPEHYVNSLFEKVKQTNQKDGSFIIEQTDGRKINLFLMKVDVYKYFPHYLIVFDSEKLPFPTSLFTIDQAALVFQFNLFKNEKIDEALYANEAYFFNGLINHKVENSYDFKNWFQVSEDYGYLNSSYYQVINIYSTELLEEHINSLKSNEKALLSYRWLRNHLDEYFSNSLIIWRAENQEIILILQEEPSNIAETLQIIANKVDNAINDELTFSVGRSFPSWKKIEQSYTQASLAYNDRVDENIIFYRDKSVNQLFTNMDTNEIYYFCKSTLKDFAYPDEENSAINDLRHTLDVYLANQCEITKTAKELFIHRNTVKYRINSCEEILGVKVDGPVESLNIRLALNLSRLDL